MSLDKFCSEMGSNPFQKKLLTTWSLEMGCFNMLLDNSSMEPGPNTKYLKNPTSKNMLSGAGQWTIKV